MTDDTHQSFPTAAEMRAISSQQVNQALQAELKQIHTAIGQAAQLGHSRIECDTLMPETKAALEAAGYRAKRYVPPQWEAQEGSYWTVEW